VALTKRLPDGKILSKLLRIVGLKFSSRSHYGLRAMIALARSYPKGPLPLAEIARAENISLNYLEQLMAPLRKAGLVESTRGVKGGYELTSDPAIVTVGQVVRTLEGPIAPAECASEIENPSCCQREMDCPSKTLWEHVRDNIAQVLDATTLADLLAPGQVGVH
jgi:Rrf2 family protein